MEIIPWELQGVIINANENIIETELRTKTKDKSPLYQKPDKANNQCTVVNEDVPFKNAYRNPVTVFTAS